MKHIKTQEERNALKTFLDSEDSQQPLRDIRSESNSNEKGRKYKRLAKKFLYADGTGKNVTKEDNYTKFFAGVPKTTAVSKVVDSIRRHINRPIKQAVKSMNPSGKLIPLDEFPLHTTTRLSFDEKTIKRFLAANLENRSLYEPELKKYVWDMENDKFAAGAIPICAYDVLCRVKAFVFRFIWNSPSEMRPCRLPTRMSLTAIPCRTAAVSASYSAMNLERMYWFLISCPINRSRSVSVSGGSPDT